MYAPAVRAVQNRVYETDRIKRQKSADGTAFLQYIFDFGGKTFYNFRKNCYNISIRSTRYDL